MQVGTQKVRNKPQIVFFENIFEILNRKILIDMQHFNRIIRLVCV